MDSLNSNRGGTGASARDLLAQLAVRAARLPLQTGLIGGEYARHVAENLAPKLAAIARGGGATPSPQSTIVESRASVRPRPAQTRTTPPLVRPPAAAPGGELERRQLDTLRSILTEAEG